MSTRERTRIVAGPAEIAEEALALVHQAEREAIERSGMFRIALAGGGTPKALYEKLAWSTGFTWSAWHVFFGDERCVPPSHPDSNFRMARETLLDRVGIPTHQIHPVPTTAGSPMQAASLYSLTIRRHLSGTAGRNGMPRFDVVLLGLGADGHTASLFPGSRALLARPGEVVVAALAPSLGVWRVSLTLSAINAARSVVFLVSGADKADALVRALEDEPEEALPAALVRPDTGSLVFLADEAASRKLGSPA